jgi:hypothetical protein
MNFMLFPHMSGVWEGTYTRLAADGAVMFKHTSRLTLKLEGASWWQTNYYEFANGKVEFHNFGVSRFNDNGVMQYDNSRIEGEAWEANGGKNILLWWSYKQEPGTMLYEMITPLSATHRTRVWQHTRNGIFEGLTMIEEWKKASQETIAPDHYEQKSYIKEA